MRICARVFLYILIRTIQKNRRSACVGFLWSITEPIKGVLYSFLYQVLTCRSPESCRHFTDT